MSDSEAIRRSGPNRIMQSLPDDGDACRGCEYAHVRCSEFVDRLSEVTRKAWPCVGKIWRRIL